MCNANLMPAYECCGKLIARLDQITAGAFQPHTAPHLSIMMFDHGAMQSANLVQGLDGTVIYVNASVTSNVSSAVQCRSQNVLQPSTHQGGCCRADIPVSVVMAADVPSNNWEEIRMLASKQKYIKTCMCATCCR